MFNSMVLIRDLYKTIQGIMIKIGAFTAFLIFNMVSNKGFK